MREGADVAGLLPAEADRVERLVVETEQRLGFDRDPLLQSPEGRRSGTERHLLFQYQEDEGCESGRASERLWSPGPGHDGGEVAIGLDQPVDGGMM